MLDLFKKETKETVDATEIKDTTSEITPEVAENVTEVLPETVEEVGGPVPILDDEIVKETTLSSDVQGVIDLNDLVEVVAPEGSTSISFGGLSYEVVNGKVSIPGGFLELAFSHGFKQAE